jgi:type II secretory pathway pseudopilin PulG
VIIGILAGLAVIGVNGAIMSSKTNATEMMIGTLQGSIRQYQVRWGDFPPSSLADMGVKGTNDLNNGIEALVACLSSKRGGGVLYQPGNEEQYVNTDDDSLKEKQSPNDWFFGDTKLRELCDFFGRTLTYVHHKDYSKPNPAILKYKFYTDSEPFTISVEQSAATKTFANPTTGQIRSTGADGKWGTPDDVKNGN